MTALANKPQGTEMLDDKAISPIEVRRLQGRWVFDDAGEVVGKIADVLVDAETKPEWLIISMGSFLRQDRLIPVFDMRPGDNGYVLSYSKKTVANAPVVNVVDTSDDDEKRLSAYWCTARSATLPRNCSLLSRS